MFCGTQSHFFYAKALQSVTVIALFIFQCHYLKVGPTFTLIICGILSTRHQKSDLVVVVFSNYTKHFQMLLDVMKRCTDDYLIGGIMQLLQICQLHIYDAYHATHQTSKVFYLCSDFGGYLSIVNSLFYSR